MISHKIENVIFSFDMKNYKEKKSLFDIVKILKVRWKK